MDEARYQELLAEGRALLKRIADFPAHELMTFAEKHHPEDRQTTSFLWAAYLESQP